MVSNARIFGSLNTLQRFYEQIRMGTSRKLCSIKCPLRWEFRAYPPARLIPRVYGSVIVNESFPGTPTTWHMQIYQDQIVCPGLALLPVRSEIIGVLLYGQIWFCTLFLYFEKNRFLTLNCSYN